MCQAPLEVLRGFLPAWGFSCLPHLAAVFIQLVC